MVSEKDRLATIRATYPTEVRTTLFATATGPCGSGLLTLPYYESVVQ
jgi:hypothetical protein